MHHRTILALTIALLATGALAATPAATPTYYLPLVLNCTSTPCTLPLSNLPIPSEWSAPAGAPAAPGDAAFSPKIKDPIPVDPQAPAIAAWSTGIVKPDESFTITASRLTRRSGAAANSDTSVWIYASGNSTLQQAQVLNVSDQSVTAVVPRGLPFGTYLVWLENEAGPSAPILLNRPAPQWLGPLGQSAAPGTTIRVFGRNLTTDHAGKTSYVYLRDRNGTFRPLTLAAVTPYAISLQLPANLAIGSYELYVHNGHGGAYGWSDPLPLTIATTPAPSSATVSIQPVTSGDQSDALQAAIDSLQPAGGTVRLSAATFTITSSFELRDNVQLIGAGRDQTRLVFSGLGFDFSGIVINGNQTGIEALTLHQAANTPMPKGHIKSVNWKHSDGIRGLRLNNLRVSSDMPTNADGGLDFDQVAQVELSNSELWRGASFGRCADVWIHDNVARGGVYLGVEQGAEAAFYAACDRLIFENNRVENDWADYRPAERTPRVGAPWARRILTSSVNYYTSEHAYITNNTAVNVAIEENKGEILLFHGGESNWYAQVASANGKIINFRTDGTVNGRAVVAANEQNSPPATSVPNQIMFGAVDGGAYAVIIGGTGLGQARRVISHTTTSITVDRDWRVPPGLDSVIVLTFLYKDQIVYNNHLSAFPDGYKPTYSASVPVSIDGNNYGVAVEANRAQRTYGGYGAAAGPTAPVFWGEFRDNTLQNAHNSLLSFTAWSWKQGDRFGLYFLGNRVLGGTYALSADPDLTHLTPSQVGLWTAYRDEKPGGIIAEGNSIEGAQLSGPTSVPVVTSNATVPAMLRNNRLAGVFTALGTAPNTTILVNNTGITSSTAAGNPNQLVSRLQPLLRVVNFVGQRGARFATIDVPIANTGLAPLAWSVADIPEWVEVVGDKNGELVSGTVGTVRLRVNPDRLRNGRTWGTLQLRATNNQTFTLGISARVDE